MWTKLNGQFEQQGNTNDMLFNVYEMVAYFSTHMVLYPETFWRRERRRASASARTGSWLWATCSNAASSTWALSGTRFWPKRRPSISPAPSRSG
jgi:hypothetical protein